MKVRLRNPDCTLEVAGPKTVADVLRELDIVPGGKPRSPTPSVGEHA